jgi:tetratricopeptide (TPR) repeat protein
VRKRERKSQNHTAHRGRRARRLVLRLSYDADLDFLWALKFGEAIDGQLPDETDEPAEGFYLYRRGPRGPVIGFGVENLSEFQLPDPDEPLLGGGLRFDAPAVGLGDASAEEVILASRTMIDDSTPYVVFFDMAVQASGDGELEAAETLWRCCLQAGDMKAHFGLAYTLCDLGRYREAYGHLRTYTKIVPRNAWAWSWLGQASEAIGEPQEAVRCYRRALRLERAGSYETDARERLTKLERRQKGRR